MDDRTSTPVKEPDFSGEEMHLPEHPVGSAEPAPRTPSAFGLIITLLAILLLAVLGGLYYWYTEIVDHPAPVVPVTTPRPTAAENDEPESTTAEAQADSLNVVSTSDELGAIEADLESTNLDTLDSELTAIEAELDAALEAGAQ